MGKRSEKNPSPNSSKLGDKFASSIKIDTCFKKEKKPNNPPKKPIHPRNLLTYNYTDLATSIVTSYDIWNTFLASWATTTRWANATVPVNLVYTRGSKGTG